MKPIFFRGGAHKIIMAISDNTNYVNKISRKISTTYSHVVGTLNELEKKGLISKKKDGRKVYIKLTDKGQKLKELLIKMELLI